ncbi:hypothetical protein ACTQ54_02260 [Fundicoccus sp. Sow4_H7]|uniref:hypothetical protein n=1 Tax=Fundicoccus sp. Sow4_H7 TaxID=3438784 RepID=UPI003F8FD020
MIKQLFLLSSILLFMGFPTVSAQSNSEVESLTEEIQALEETLQDKKEALAILREDLDGYYTIETINATYVFSNPRIEDDLLVLDLDFTNDSKGALAVTDELWMLSFFQEDDISLQQLWVYYENLPEVEGRRPISYNTRIKSGATVQLVLALTKSPEVYYGEPYLYEDLSESENLDEVDEEIIEVQEPFDDFSPLLIQVDPYNHPSGQSAQIEIPLE